MKCEIVTYEHSANGLSLYVVPETDAERGVLKGLFNHGRCEITNGVVDGTGQGFCVQWRFDLDVTAKKKATP